MSDLELAAASAGKEVADKITAMMDRIVLGPPTYEPLGLLSSPRQDFVSDAVRTDAALSASPFLNEPPVAAGDPAKMFRVKLLLHSVSPDDVELLTWRITAPRVILAEVNTHRALSKSSESSRAHPPAKRIAQVKDVPYRPLRYGVRIKGMGAGDDLTEEKRRLAAGAFDAARRACVAAAEVMCEADLAKEELNRVLEPWALCRTVLTGTDWNNFYALRTHEAAHPAFRFLARAMWVARRRSSPTRLDYNQWHLPFITDKDRAAVGGYQTAAWCKMRDGERGRPHNLIGWEDYHLARWSAARCARTSYGLNGKEPDPVSDDATWAKLVSIQSHADASVVIPGKFRVDFDGYHADPLHAGPLEHQGTPLHPAQGTDPALRSNLRGWAQFRKLFVGENLTRFEPPADVVDEWERAIPAAVFDGPDLY